MQVQPTAYRRITELPVMLLAVLSILAYACLWTCATAAHQRIVVAPETQLVPFNLNDTVPFECVVEGDELVWQVAGIQLATPDLIARAGMSGIFVEGPNVNGTFLSSRLLIFVNENVSDEQSLRNNTGVKCIAEGETVLDSAQSEEVFLITYTFPDPPSNLRLTVVTINPEGNLTMQWDPPTNVPSGVDTSHNVAITHLIDGDSYPGFPMPFVTESFVIVQEVLLDNCTPYEFTVLSENGAGRSVPVSINDTIPISPNVIPISNSLASGTTVSFNEEGDPVISLSFQPAITCSDNFPVASYLIHISGGGMETTVNVSETGISDDVIVMSLTGSNVPGLRANVEYTIAVTACSIYICRDSDPVQIATSEVGANRVLYTEGSNQVYLTCTFVAGSTTRGCGFRFTLRNDSEVFNVTRDDPSSPSASLCMTTENHADAYDRVEVVSLEGETLVLTAVLQLDDDMESVAMICPVADNESDDGLSDTAIYSIVGGSIAAVVILAVVLAVVIAACCYFRKVELKVPWSLVRHQLGGSADSILELPSGNTTPLFSRRGQPQTEQVKVKRKHLGFGTLSRKEGLQFKFDPHKLQSLKKHCKVSHPEDEVCLNVYCDLQPTKSSQDRESAGTKL